MRTEDTHLVWTDGELQLLLETARDFKAKKAYAEVNWETFMKPFCQIYPSRQAVKKVHIQPTSSLEEGLHLKSNRFEQNIKKLWM